MNRALYVRTPLQTQFKYLVLQVRCKEDGVDIYPQLEASSDFLTACMYESMFSNKT